MKICTLIVTATPRLEIFVLEYELLRSARPSNTLILDVLLFPLLISQKRHSHSDKALILKPARIPRFHAPGGIANKDARYTVHHEGDKNVPDRFRGRRVAGRAGSWHDVHVRQS